MKIAISTETTVDLSQEMLEKYDIRTVPFTIVLGENTELDGIITPKDIFEFVEENKVLPKTSAVNQFQYEEMFDKLSKEFDYVIHISLSSEMSCAGANARMAAENYNNVHVIDSLSLCSGIALLCIFARELADKGYEPEKIIDLLEKRKKYVCLSLVPQTTAYLYKGGRCSALQRFGSALLRIKPQLILKEDGKLYAGKKYFGKKVNVVKDYCSDVFEEYNNPDLSMAFIAHAYAPIEMVDAAKDCLKERGFKVINKAIAGCTIASHTGPAAIGIMYFNDGGKYAE